MSDEDPCTGPGTIPDPLPGPRVEPPAGEQANNGDIAALLQEAYRSFLSMGTLGSQGRYWLGAAMIF